MRLRVALEGSLSYDVCSEPTSFSRALEREMTSLAKSSLSHQGHVIALLLVLITACSDRRLVGSDRERTEPAGVFRISVLPKSAEFMPGDSLALVAWGHLMSGDSVVIPTVSYEATGGTITKGGVYTAGTTPGAYRIIANYKAGRKADTSIVTIFEPVRLLQLALKPAALTLAPGEVVQLTASGTWSDGSSINPAVSYTATGGAITAEGVYTAGTVPGAYRIVASHEEGTQADTSNITITKPVVTLLQLALSPASLTLVAGGTGQVAVSGTWSDGSSAVPAITYTATGGIITAGGLFTAGTTPGIYQIIARQKAGTAADTSLVAITAPAETLPQLVLSPASLTLAAGETAQFTISATGSVGTSTVPAVNYVATGGTITPGGLYTAGTAPGVYRIIATDQSGLTADTSIVTISSSAVTLLQLVLSPASLAVVAGDSVQLTVSGTWSDGTSTMPAVSYRATGGMITAGGSYTAGTQPGVYRIIASHDGGSHADTSVVTISAPVVTLLQLALSPASVTLASDGTRQFTVSGIWSDGSKGLPAVTYTAKGGTITTRGFYTAGKTPGVYRIVASQQGGSEADTSTVTISPPPVTLLQLVLNPKSPTIDVGETVQFTVSGRLSDGSSTVPTVTYTATGGSITASGFYIAGNTAGSFRVIARHNTGTAADTAVLSISGQPADPIFPQRQWTVSDDGASVEARGTVLRAKFAYNARAGAGGWFRGGGGRDGGIVELYYNPTSPTRNLVFRNGTYGGKLDNLDFFQAELASPDKQGHNTPDFTSGVHAVPIRHRVWEDAGRLFAEFEFQFAAWRIRRTYILYPWGDITVHSRLTQTQGGLYSNLAHSFQFGVSEYQFQNGTQNYRWGGQYERDGESMYAWSDGYPLGVPTSSLPYQYSDVISQGLDRNTEMSNFGRQDPYSGMMLDDRNRSDPDIIVMNGDSATFFSPVDRIARIVGGKSYVETGIFSAPWAPDGATHANLNFFYNTLPPCCPVQYDKALSWPISLGTWEEVFHILLRQDLDPVDYLPIWNARARELGRVAPSPAGGAQVRLDETDRLYHVRAAANASSVQFTWKRHSTANRSTNYRTAFVVENFPSGRSARVEGSPELSVQAYRDPMTGNILLELEGAEPAIPTAYTITVTP